MGNVSGNSSDPCSESGMKNRQKWVGSSIPCPVCVHFWVIGGRPGCLGWAGGRQEEGGRDEPMQGPTSLSKEFGLVSKVLGRSDTIDSQFIFILLLPNVFPILMLDKSDFRAKSI